MLLSLNGGGNGQSSIFTWVFLIVAFLVMMVVIRRFGNKRVAQMEEQREQVKSSMLPGTWVRTTSGFYGKVVEVSGEVVTLANYTGDETIWDVRAIAEVREPDFGKAFEPDAESAESPMTDARSGEAAKTPESGSHEETTSEESHGPDLENSDEDPKNEHKF